MEQKISLKYKRRSNQLPSRSPPAEAPTPSHQETGLDPNTKSQSKGIHRAGEKSGRARWSRFQSHTITGRQRMSAKNRLKSIHVKTAPPNYMGRYHIGFRP